MIYVMLQLFQMADKRSRAKKIIASFTIVAVLVTGYFYLPSILGDSVFPLQYQDIIKKWCREYNEDPFLVAAIIMQESGFNPKATSPVGAMGLMQVMPPTGRSIASGVEYPNFTTDKLYDPDVSIQFGTWYIHVLKEKYGGNVTAALAAYNAGSGNADKWLRMGLLTKPSDNSFARRVQDYMQVYHKLYQNDLDLNATPSASQPAIKKVDESSRNIVWGQILRNLVSLVYNVNQK